MTFEKIHYFIMEKESIRKCNIFKFTPSFFGDTSMIILLNETGAT